MRQIKRISFLVYSCLLLAAGFYGHIKYVELFYPGSRRMDGMAYEREEDRTVQAAAASVQISFDTEFVVVSCDLSDGQTRQSEERMPAKYVGLGREDFVRCMENEAAAPTLSERQKGLISIEVESFSTSRVVVRRFYRKQDVAASFYLALYDNRVVIYEADQRTVYMKTFIDGRTLPQPVRDELVRGMVVEGNERLEAFLEEYGQVPASE